MKKKNEFLSELAEDFAVSYNILTKEAVHYKQLYDIVLGAQNALQSGAYDDLEFDEFKEMMMKDLQDISNSW